MGGDEIFPEVSKKNKNKNINTVIWESYVVKTLLPAMYVRQIRKFLNTKCKDIHEKLVYIVPRFL